MEDHHAKYKKNCPRQQKIERITVVSKSHVFVIDGNDIKIANVQKNYINDCKKEIKN